MSGFAVQTSANAQALMEDALSGRGFAPLPKGQYQVTIVPVKKDPLTKVEIVPFSKKPEYAGKQAVRIAVRIVDESPTGAKQHFFDRIPLFHSFAPSQKYPQGAPAFSHFQFFSALGVSKEDLAAGILPGPDEIMGKRISIFLGEPKEPDQYNELGSNEITGYGAPGDLERTPTLTPGVPVAKWLDANGNLIPGYSSGAATAAAPATPGVPAWGGPAAAPAAAPAGSPWQAPLTPPNGAPTAAPNVTPGPWGQPGGDAIQQAALAGQTY